MSATGVNRWKECVRLLRTLFVSRLSFDPLNRIFRRLTTILKLALLIICTQSYLIYAQEDHSMELYSERPSLSNLEAKPWLPFIGKSDFDREVGQIRAAKWAKIKSGMLNYLAELKTFYPDEHLFFLARDGEYFFELNKIANRPWKQSQSH